VKYKFFKLSDHQDSIKGKKFVNTLYTLKIFCTIIFTEKNAPGMPSGTGSMLGITAGKY
jgi:hypothetical protein